MKLATPFETKVAWPKPTALLLSMTAASEPVVNVGDAAELLLSVTPVGFAEAATHLYKYGGVPPLTVTPSVAWALNPAGALAATGTSTIGSIAVSSRSTTVDLVASTEMPSTWRVAQPLPENVREWMPAGTPLRVNEPEAPVVVETTESVMEMSVTVTPAAGSAAGSGMAAGLG
ncbi:MAG TPA: hypothetical protein VLU43_16940 [Anaeromyxobacteraceae bacterium]|nr:hypothetical protein [Anaeromyxobacteraceae bacterium]